MDEKVKDKLQEHYENCEYCIGSYLCPSAIIIVKSLLSEKDKEIERLKEQLREDNTPKQSGFDRGYRNKIGDNDNQNGC